MTPLISADSSATAAARDFCKLINNTSLENAIIKLFIHEHSRWLLGFYVGLLMQQYLAELNCYSALHTPKVMHCIGLQAVTYTDKFFVEVDYRLPLSVMLAHWFVDCFATTTNLICHHNETGCSLICTKHE